jgi:hypothetical protein
MRQYRSAVGLVSATALVVCLAPEASAQHRRGHRPGHGRSFATVHYTGGFGYPYAFAYPYGLYGGFSPYPGYYFAGADGFPESAALRLRVEPSEAEVYVDGRLVGQVKQFDGLFQRLHVEPGPHTLELYLEGYRVARQDLYLNPGTSYRIRHELAPLEDGEEMEARPRPAAIPEEGSVAPDPGDTAPPPVARGFGVLRIRLQPAGARLAIDGEAWPERLGTETEIHLPAGRHRVEIRAQGCDPFEAEVEIGSGEETSLNVKLSRLPEGGVL